MDTADDELRAVICNIWPALAKKQVKLHEGGTKSLLDLVVPPKTGTAFCLLVARLGKTFVAELHGATGQPKLTVGKLYAMALYIDNYRSFKQGHSNDTGVSRNGTLEDRRTSSDAFFDPIFCSISDPTQRPHAS